MSISALRALQWLFDPLRLAADVSLHHSSGAVREAPDPCLPLWGRCPVRTLGGEGLPGRRPQSGVKNLLFFACRKGKGQEVLCSTHGWFFRICEAAGDRSLFPPGGKKKMVVGKEVY